MIFSIVMAIEWLLVWLWLRPFTVLSVVVASAICLAITAICFVQIAWKGSVDLEGSFGIVAPIMPQTILTILSVRSAAANLIRVTSTGNY